MRKQVSTQIHAQMLCEHSHWQQCIPFVASSICEHLRVLCEWGLALLSCVQLARKQAFAPPGSALENWKGNCLILKACHCHLTQGSDSSMKTSDNSPTCKRQQITKGHTGGEEASLERDNRNLDLSDCCGVVDPECGDEPTSLFVVCLCHRIFSLNLAADQNPVFVASISGHAPLASLTPRVSLLTP